MIKIRIAQISDDSSWRKWRRWRRDCNRATLELINAANQGGKPEIDESLYKRKSIKEMFFFSPLGPFGGKCAYCESYIKNGLDADIEHYRPKAGVTNENDCPIMIKDNADIDICHPGYYWLAYDWHNLLPACKHCNELKPPRGKGNQFPVANGHAIQPGDEVEEQPFLLHPVYDNPEEHLAVDLDTGLVIPTSLRGKETIKILNLNRDHLPDERRKTIDHIKSLLDAIFSIHTSQRIKQKAVSELSTIKQGQTSHCLAAKCYFKIIPPGLEQLLANSEAEGVI